MKKTDVYVVIDTPKKAKKLKRVLDMFGEGVYENRVWNNDGYTYYSFDYYIEYWVGDSLRDSEYLKNKTRVSIKELRNILAKEHLKAGDVVFMRHFKGEYESILKIKGVKGEYLEVDKELFVKGSDHIYSDGQELIKDFIRYATEEEKALLEPKKELEIGKWYVFSWYHDPNDVIGVYLIDKINYDEVWFKYGVNISGNYWSERDWYSKTHNWRLATPQEVEQALIEEAKRRGHAYTEYDYNPIENELCGISKGRLESVFCDGHWEQPVDNFPDSDVSIVERLHDTLLENHGYSLDSELLTKARKLAIKLRK